MRGFIVRFRQWLRETYQKRLLKKARQGIWTLYYINGPETLPAPLTREEEAVVFARLEEHDETAKEQLIVHNLRLVVYIARKFESTGVGIEDLISIGTIGLIKAVNTFCPSRNIKLATYASRCIENEILMYLRKFQIVKNEVSIDEPLNIDWDGNELLLSDILGTDNDTVGRSIEQEIEKNILMDAVSRLGPRERTIMELRFGLCGGQEKTQKEVADIIGISQSYISRLEKKIIKNLKKDLERAY
ncbi:MAG: RNA polymerase sporulation sigma factor SigE [Angelakisella sp.]|nr:RNA polymerase sporulation sigma factor SigE [Angelakisella sp.]